MKKTLSALAPFLGIILVFALWFLVCRLGIFSTYVLPPPEKVFDSFLKMLKSGEIFEDVIISLARILKIL